MGGEYIEQCWFIAKVTSLPVILVALPLGSTISLQVGEISRQLGAQSATGAAVVTALTYDVLVTSRHVTYLSYLPRPYSRSSRRTSLSGIASIVVPLPVVVVAMNRAL